MFDIIKTKDAPAAIGPYAQAVKTGNMLFISGQLPIDPETGKIEGASIMAQTHQALKNLEAILAEADMGMSNVVKVGVFVSDMDDFNTINGIYKGFFSESFPARFVVEVSRLPKDALIEIDAIAVKQ